MKLVRRLAAAAGVLALSGGMVVASGPAHAATTANVTVTLTVTNYSNPGHPRYGDYISVNAEAKAPSSDYFISTGSVSIQSAPAGSTAWKTVATNPSTYAFYSLKGLTKKVQFRAVYSGGTGDHYSGSTFETATFPAASSTTYAISKVDRGQLVVKSTKKLLCSKVGPKPYKSKPVYHYVRIGKSKKWRLSYVEHTNRKSQICYHLHHAKVKKHSKYKGPKVKAEKTVYVKTGGMKKSVQITKF